MTVVFTTKFHNYSNEGVVSLAGASKKYAKINVNPETARIIKRIAAEKNIYVYELIDEMVKEKYLEWFAKDTKIRVNDKVYDPAYTSWSNTGYS